MVRKMYHTQEERGELLKEPIECNREDAWLGDACYFWLSEKDAITWGEKSKRKTGWYDIYVATIDCENVLNTVFNEEHYNVWLKAIETVAMRFIKDTFKKPTLKELNTYLKERGEWKSVTGILFQDLPNAEYYTLIQPIIYRDKDGNPRKAYFAYKKRIQLALYNNDALLTFAHYSKNEC